MQTKVGARMSVRGMSRLGFLVSSAIWLTLPAPESVLVRRPDGGGEAREREPAAERLAEAQLREVYVGHADEDVDADCEHHHDDYDVVERGEGVVAEVRDRAEYDEQRDADEYLIARGGGEEDDEVLREHDGEGADERGLQYALERHPQPEEGVHEASSSRGRSCPRSG